MNSDLAAQESALPHKRRTRYSGKYPRRFEEKYKERDAAKYPETVAKVLASGKTPAGTHVPIMVAQILRILDPKPGGRAVDCTLGYGGHSEEILKLIQPGGKLIGIDVDPIEQPKTELRLAAKGFSRETFSSHRANFAGLPQVLAKEAWPGADYILADLGVSSMQIDTPDRGFSVKHSGPLDMRMNPLKGQSASALLARIDSTDLAGLLTENADEPQSALLADKLAGKLFERTTDCAKAIREILYGCSEEKKELAVRRVFQALRIAVNEEFEVPDRLLCNLPFCLNSGGKVAILSFHSGEDRRVKKAFQTGLRQGLYSDVSEEVIRASSTECRDNPRASAAKLRWARKG